MSYRYNEFTPEEFDYFDRLYNGTFTYLVDLPHDTKFRVVNGGWDGRIIKKDDKTFVGIEGLHTFEVDEQYSLWITKEED